MQGYFYINMTIYALSPQKSIGVKKNHEKNQEKKPDNYFYRRVRKLTLKWR